MALKAVNVRAITSPDIDWFSAKSVGEKISKIGQYLAMLEAKI